VDILKYFSNRRFSLTGRLIAVVVGCQLLLTAALTLMAVVYGRSELREAFDAALEGRATSTLALVRYDENTPPGLLFDSSLLPPTRRSRHRDVFEIRAADGHILAQAGPLDGVPIHLSEGSTTYSDLTINGAPYRAVVLRNVAVLDNEESVKVPARVTVVYASSVMMIRRRLTDLAFYVAGTSLLMLLAASGLAVWGVRRGLEPLRELAAQASAISVHNWGFRPPPPEKMASELAPLSRAIGTVLDRLRESFRQQRDFTSDAAHELKTSVAILKSTLQTLTHRPRAEQEYRDGLEMLLEDCARLEDLLDRMLRLARIEQWAENGTPREIVTAELSSTCEAAILRMQRIADARNIALELINPMSMRLRADPKDLELIWVNLLENAVQYGPAGSKVAMRIQRDGDLAATVSVEDSGPGVELKELPYIFERFRRGDPSRARSTGGFGLGLAICKALVEAYGGHIEAINRPERGTSIRVQLPAEPV
jgi:signal transduction histidine kinase